MPIISALSGDVLHTSHFIRQTFIWHTLLAKGNSNICVHIYKSMRVKIEQKLTALNDSFKNPLARSVFSSSRRACKKRMHQNRCSGGTSAKQGQMVINSLWRRVFDNITLCSIGSGRRCEKWIIDSGWWGVQTHFLLPFASVNSLDLPRISSSV